MAHSHVKSYVVVYIALLLLVAVTVFVAHIPTGPFAFHIAFFIALVKATLIGVIFMHLKDEAPLVRVFAIAGIFWLGLLFTFTMADYLTRKDMRPLPNDVAYAARSGSGEHAEKSHDHAAEQASSKPEATHD